MQSLRPHLTSPAGLHVLADFHGARALRDPMPARDVFRAAAEAAGATVLDLRFHDFGTRSGFTGVALLAESHISVHTWPETDYAALDIFMCGTCDPMIALDHLRAYFAPRHETVTRLRRGDTGHDARSRRDRAGEIRT